jgi:hypothetical protein
MLRSRPSGSPTPLDVAEKSLIFAKKQKKRLINAEDR